VTRSSSKEDLRTKRAAGSARDRLCALVRGRSGQVVTPGAAVSRSHDGARQSITAMCRTSPRAAGRAARLSWRLSGAAVRRARRCLLHECTGFRENEMDRDGDGNCNAAGQCCGPLRGVVLAVVADPALSSASIGCW
jgi:hypothetical protein